MPSPAAARCFICVAGQAGIRSGADPAGAESGDVVNILRGSSTGTAQQRLWFQHIAIDSRRGTGTEWCESVDDAIYNSL
jgi:hypothetical protein